MDLRERFEVAFEDAPEARAPHRSVDERLRAGRATVRRRRAAGVAGGVAAAAVIGAVGWQVLEPEQRVVEAPYAGIPDAPSEQRAPSDPDWPVVEAPGATDVDVSPEHEIVVPPGTRVVELISDPLAGVDSVGLELDLPGEPGTLFLLADDRRGLTSQYEPAGEDYTTLAHWVADAAAVGTGAGILDGLVEVGPDGRLVAMDPSVEVVDQVADPEIGPEFALPAEHTLAAEITVDGKAWFVYGQFLPEHREHAQLYRVEPSVLQDRSVAGLVAHVNAGLEAEVAAEGDR